MSESYRYRRDMVPIAHNEPIRIMAGLLNEARSVLELGPGSGQLAQILKRQGLEVTGIEMDPKLAEASRKHLAKLIVGDIERLDLAIELGTSRFDAIACGDILEHLYDPVSVIRQLLPFLQPEGALVASIPNVAHGAVRLSLLQGRFEYSPHGGLLDETHTRFFTRASIEGMLQKLGLHAHRWVHVMRDPLDTELQISIDDLPPGILDYVRSDPESLVYQYVVLARRSPSPEIFEEEIASQGSARPSEPPHHPGDEITRLRQELADSRSRIAEMAKAEEHLYQWKIFIRRLPRYLIRRLAAIFRKSQV